MARKNSLLSDALKYEFAKEMGVAHKLFNNGNNFNYEFGNELTNFDLENSTNSLDFGNLSSRECGNFVKLAIQRAEQNLV